MAGTTFSFYSYKGGVGRSMALANLAVLFYRRPLDVVVVDWDLEAPGIERYLADRYPRARSEVIEHRPGLCDLIQDYRARLAEPPEPGEEPMSPYPDLDDYLVTLDSQHDCSLRVLTAGDRTDWGRYARFVQSFDWTDFYANWGGGGFFEWLRESLADQCDLVLGGHPHRRDGDGRSGHPTNGRRHRHPVRRQRGEHGVQRPDGAKLPFR